MHADRPSAPRAPAKVVRQPDEVGLFLFSAATWLSHRIHYDRDFARIEGHADLPVQGPLQGAYLIELAAARAREGGEELCSVTYRHVAPLYCGESVECTIAPAGEQSGGMPDGEYALEVRTCDPPHRVTTIGTAQIGKRAAAREPEDDDGRSDDPVS